ncbi:MAG: DUF4367 domain-containing protein [Clostridia bacterium]|nr:DUF4367 domain-containing protein [Clostridia bacterium]
MVQKPEAVKTSDELREELTALKLRLVFQEAFEDKIDDIMREEEADPEGSALIAQGDRRVRKLVRQKLRRNRGRRFIRRGLPRVAKIAAAMLLVFYIGLSAAVATVPAVRVKVLRFIMHIEDQYTSLSFEDGGQVIEIPTEWDGLFYPAYIPERFKMVGRSANEVEYEDPSGAMLCFSEFTQDTTVNMDTEDAEMSYIDLSGKHALVSVKGNWVFVTWATGNRYFIVDLEGTKEEAIMIADSVTLIR